jgi:hypothetical protein
MWQTILRKYLCFKLTQHCNLLAHKKNISFMAVFKYESNKSSSVKVTLVV